MGSDGRRGANGIVAGLVAAATLASLLLAPGATASQRLVASRASTAGTRGASCTGRPLAGPGVYRESFTSPALGSLTATLARGHGDWDLAVFSAGSGETVAGSAYSGSEELAQGFAFAGERLIAQVCRRPGASGSPDLRVELDAITRERAGPAPALLQVEVRDRDDLVALATSGLDVVGSGEAGYVDVVGHRRTDTATLARIGLPYVTVIEDMTEQDAASARRGGAVDGDGFPSGRTGTYRRLFDYSEEMKALADRYPNLVRSFTLPERTYEGRPVEGIEISTHVGRIHDGKPIFLQLGVHHAREWPSAEHALEWAYELLTGYRQGSERARRLIKTTRTIIVPVVNPDGFNVSREAGELEGAAGGRGGDATQETINIISHPLEYKRKNCRLASGGPGGDCMQPTNPLDEPGVDPNRNYGAFWGGPGAGIEPGAADYRGPRPFSEPETQNMRWLISTRQVTGLITNHTFGELVLRPPGIASKGSPIDARLLKRLGRRMVRENGYDNFPGYRLYETTGTTEDWAYYATGALGYTFEIGGVNFHPPFADTVAEWNGTSTSAPEGGGGNRAAYYRMASFVADPKSHATITGRGPRGGTISVRKSFRTPTSPVIGADGTEGRVRRLRDRLVSEVGIGRDGRFRFAVNPSTRPLVATSRGRKAEGPPSEPVTFSGEPTAATPCLDSETEDPSCWIDHAFVVPDERGRDNDAATVRIEWESSVSDWDMKVFRDTDGDGSSEGERRPVAVSASGGTTFEEATVGGRDLIEGERYVVRVISFIGSQPYQGSVTFLGPERRVAARRERWTLTCRTAAGRVTGSRKLYVERGQLRRLDLRTGC